MFPKNLKKTDEKVWDKRLWKFVEIPSIVLELCSLLLLCLTELLNSVPFCLHLFLSNLLSSYSPAFLFFIPLSFFLISAVVIISWSAFPSAINSWNFLSTICSISYSSMPQLVLFSKVLYNILNILHILFIF